MLLAKRSPRSLRKTVLLLFGVLGLYTGLVFLSRWLFRTSLNDALHALGAIIRPGTEPGTYINLLDGSAMITGLHLLADEKNGTPLTTEGSIDTLAITGFSYWDLFRDRIHAKSLLLRTSDLRIQLLAQNAKKNTRPIDFSALRIDRMDIRTGGLAFAQKGDSGFTCSAKSFFCAGGGFDLRASADKWSLRALGESDLRFDSLAADLRNEQCIELARFDLDQQQATLTLQDLHFGPYDDLDHFARTRPLEGDVADCRVPLLRISGLRPPDHLDTPWVAARSVLIDGAEAHIYRDKTRPDGPSHITKLVARLLRELPLGCGADSIMLRNSDIIYNECGSTELGFGRIPFERMNALVLGARNDGNDSSQCTIEAQCVAFERALVDFRFATRIRDTTDRFAVEAHIGRMPFRTLNSAFGPLLEVQAIEGVVDTIVLWMDADDRAARGRVRLAYRDLRVVNGAVPTKSALTKPLSLIMNVLIPNEKELGDIASTDERFAFPRGREHSIFNYLWLGLREGAKKVLLPKPLAK